MLKFPVSLQSLDAVYGCREFRRCNHVQCSSRYPVARVSRRAADPIVGRPPLQDPARWTSNPAASRYVNASGNPSSFSERFGPFLADVRDAAEAVGTRANAV